MTNESQITVVGGVTADPVDRSNGSDKAFVTLSLATTPRIFDKAANEWKDGETGYWPAYANGALAEAILQGVSKGSQVVALGEVQARSWEKDGVKQTRMELRLLALGVQVRRDTGAAPRRTEGQADEPWAASAPASSGSYADETPF